QDEIHVNPNRLAKYDAVAKVLADAQRLGATHIGFSGIDQYNYAVRVMAVAKRAATPHASPFYDDCERGLVMTARNLRAALTAILLGTATAGVTALALTPTAQALTASPKVGPLLKEAVTMINAKNYAGAKAKVREADAAKSTPDYTALTRT